MGESKSGEYMRRYRERQVARGKKRYEFWLTPDQLKKIKRMIKEWKS